MHEQTINPKVLLSTSLGSIELELEVNIAPLTVKNFLSYVNNKHYNGTIFHRIIDNFMVQGGGMTADMKEKNTQAPIKNEAANGVKKGLKNDEYTIAMARTMDPHSATAQFFINVKNNDFLNFTQESLNGYGYAVFGKVTKGFEVIDKMKKVKTGQKGMHSDVPLEPIIILEAIEIKA